uniref:Uncharacterized protein n=1 Tax=Magallana gigas TaxID=29159 RepID=K1Q8M0_MAGGI
MVFAPHKLTSAHFALSVVVCPLSYLRVAFLRLLLFALPVSAHKLSRRALYVDWENQSYSSIDRQRRALQEIEGLRTVFNNTKINLLDPCDFHALNSVWCTRFYILAIRHRTVESQK